MKWLSQSLVRRVSGFGANSVADAYVFRPKSHADIRASLDLARSVGLKVALRGAGRSYGDPAIAREQVVLDFSEFNQILAWDPSSGVVTCQGGVTLEQLWRHCLADGWFLPVTSGTMFPTLAGALGMNIHGKNNFRAGTLGEHVLSLQVLLVSGETLTLTPADELFYAFISGAGLLGIIVEVSLQMHRVSTPMLAVEGRSAESLEQHFSAFEAFAEEADYMVSWVDCFGRGRGLFHWAKYAHHSSPCVQNERDGVGHAFPPGEEGVPRLAGGRAVDAEGSGSTSLPLEKGGELSESLSSGEGDVHAKQEQGAGCVGFAPSPSDPSGATFPSEEGKA